MLNLEEFDELKDVLDRAKSSCRLNISRVKEMIQLHPDAGNEKYLPVDETNLKVLEEMEDMLGDLKEWPDE
jgi:hypothetical protein